MAYITFLQDLARKLHRVRAYPAVKPGPRENGLSAHTTLPSDAADADPAFTEPCDDPRTVWTAGFLNERFPQPVSPLGWSLVKDIFEQRALRDPLRFLGTPDCNALQVIRLYRGHPYINMRVMQTIYKVFPDAVLSDDAARFFINRDVALRKKVPHPRGLLDPRFVISMLRHFARDPGNWSPLHNHSRWRRFARHYDEHIARAAQRLDGASPTDLLSIAADIQTWNDRLLAIHRWSLTYAELFYTVLRRVVQRWVDPHGWQEVAADLTTGERNMSLAANEALERLAMLANTAGEDSQTFRDALANFLEAYGHRSPSLDIFLPTLADAPAQALRMIRELPVSAQQVAAPDRALEARRRVQQSLTGNGIERILPLRCLLVLWLAGMCRRYLPLREDQRFYWQKGLALLRRIYLRLGQHLVEEGLLEKTDDVFFLTAHEIAALPTSQVLSGDTRLLALSRRKTFERLHAEWAAAPSASYPPFLLGDSPLIAAPGAEKTLVGVPVSPGIGRGPVYIALDSRHLDQVPSGSILVAPSADPGWTPVFPRLAGLVLESGGQLSHAAVVAREYSLPAVTGIADATTRLHSGQIVVVDGSAGTVAPAAC